MKFPNETKLIRASKHVHRNWYLETYPDVAELGMEPADHYYRYGAAMGRNPGKNFDTKFYLSEYPDARESGLNPLLHYVLHGKAAGYATRPKAAKPGNRIQVIRTKLLSLGFTERPLEELTAIAEDAAASPEAHSLAARELALWHMRAKTEEGYRTALGWIARARPEAPDLTFRSKLATVELLCHYHLGETEAGQEAYDRAALAGEATPDLTLARANFEPTPEDRVLWINQVLAHYRIEPVTLLPDDGQPAYDRLTGGVDLPKVTEGPKVTVLIAAYDAAEMLSTALRSLQEQTWQNLEIFVLDDCSPTPDTVEVAERFAAQDPRIQVVRMKQNGGAYVARNRGLDLATGEFVTLHDADDWSHPKKIETQVRFMMENPEVMGCTSEQARCRSSLEFTKRVSARGGIIILNTSSFLWRRVPVTKELGYWDSTRFGADNEFVRRVEKVFGAESIVSLKTGPLSFQRDEGSSVTGDEAKGFNGVFYGARRQYMETQLLHHKNAENLRYNSDLGERPFPAPNLMLLDSNELRNLNYDVVLASDFRMMGGSTVSNSQEICCQRRAGVRTGVLPMFRYNSNDMSRPILPEIMNEIDGRVVNFVSYGEKVKCKLLVVRYPSVLDYHLRYMPHIDADEIKVIVNQPPMSDYGPTGEVRYDLARCAENIRRYFGKDATWHPIGPLVRDALHTHHADQLHHIYLSDQDWHNIIDIKGWDRGPRQRGPQDRLRIGRHSRDHVHKWPDTAQDILSAYPDAEDVDVHVLGGAKTPAGILGHTPRNWVVHEFGSLHPRDFLRDIDVWIYFANPGWVESFGRTIIEAMATGVPVILPEMYRPLFKESVLYATPQKAVEIARRLHADPAAYDRQVEIAKTYARDNFSYEMHLDRIGARRP